ncbi:MAG: hypothetical protein QF638_01925 [Acidimicrobiales bacterium]|nr:hypothetical protein [Acidimicrobiales bacterium]
MTKKVLSIGLLLITALGCSNDTELPTAYHQGYLAMPTDVEVSLNSGNVEVVWQIESTENVTAFVISFTDATGGVETRSVEDPDARSFVEDGLNTDSGTVIQVQVRTADENDFLGPLSAVVTLTIE